MALENYYCCICLDLIKENQPLANVELDSVQYWVCQDCFDIRYGKFNLAGLLAAYTVGERQYNCNLCHTNSLTDSIFFYDGPNEFVSVKLYFCKHCDHVLKP